MFATINHKGKTYKTDLGQPIDISIPLAAGPGHVSAWYVDPVKIEPVKMGNWVGDVKQGASVNFRNIFFNPHGNGTHTECVGHISSEHFSINQSLKNFFFITQLISILPQEKNGDRVVTIEAVKETLGDKKPEALIIRTLSNPMEKLVTNYSNTNPPYLEKGLAKFLVESGIDHLLVDTPSVDREQDNGVLQAHHEFWEYPHNTQHHRTITEMIYVPNQVYDGTYLLNLQIASFENDATPSKPVLFRIID